MEMVLLTALGVGGATVLGSIIGFALKNLSHKFSDLLLSFAAGVMLAAAVLKLVDRRDGCGHLRRCAVSESDR